MCEILEVLCHGNILGLLCPCPRIYRSTIWYKYAADAQIWATHRVCHREISFADVWWWFESFALSIWFVLLNVGVKISGRCAGPVAVKIKIAIGFVPCLHEFRTQKKLIPVKINWTCCSWMKQQNLSQLKLGPSCGSTKNTFSISVLRKKKTQSHRSAAARFFKIARALKVLHFNARQSVRDVIPWLEIRACQCCCQYECSGNLAEAASYVRGT